MKYALAERAWRDKRIEVVKAYLVAQNALLDKFGENLFRSLIEKVKIQSMVEVVFVFKAGVEVRAVLG